MGLERYVVDAVLLEKRGVSEVAQAHGISRYWLYQLLARFREGRSRALGGLAHSHPPVTDWIAPGSAYSGIGETGTSLTRTLAASF